MKRETLTSNKFTFVQFNEDAEHAETTLAWAVYASNSQSNKQPTLFYLSLKK